MSTHEKKVALLLTGGGARGAYQAGVLKAFGEICKKRNITKPFDIICGTSSGAINAAYLAAHADDFYSATKNLALLWSEIHSDQVIKTSFRHFSFTLFRWAKALTLPSKKKTKNPISLLDASPLRELLNKHIPCEQISKQIKNHTIDALALSSINYYTGHLNIFYDCTAEIEPWQRYRRNAIHTKIKCKHILASAAIPLLFQPIKIGDKFYGDGSIRNYTFFSPAIRLGANHILAIGSKMKSDSNNTKSKSPAIARIVSVLLNTLILDGLEIDLERLSTINELVNAGCKHHDMPKRHINALLIRPHSDLGKLASGKLHLLPKPLRYLVHRLGSAKEGADLLSYILFESLYTKKLLALGYADGKKNEHSFIKMLK